MDTSTIVDIVVIAAGAIFIVALAMIFFKRHHTTELENRYGTEYKRVVKMHGRRKGEAELSQRETRVSRFEIHALEPIERAQFSDRWTAVQAEFVDAPRTAVQHGDVLLQEVMLARGYPNGRLRPARGRLISRVRRPRSQLPPGPNDQPAGERRLHRGPSAGHAQLPHDVRKPAQGRGGSGRLITPPRDDDHTSRVDAVDLTIEAAVDCLERQSGGFEHARYFAQRVEANVVPADLTPRAVRGDRP